MDFSTFTEKLLNDDLKSLNIPQKMQDWLGAKYQDFEILGAYKLNDSHIGIYFKHKLWHKLAIFRGDEWIETRVKSLKNKLPEETMETLVKNLKKAMTLIILESVIPLDAVFYFYIIGKIGGKKYVLHVSREGEILLKSKFMEYSIRLEDDDEDDSDDDSVEGADDDLEEVEELVAEVELDEDDMD